MTNPNVITLPFLDYESTVSDLLDRLEIAPVLARQSLILLKPNVVTDSPPPVTTDAAMVAAVARYCRRVSRATVLVVEGSGEGDTLENFRRLGYGRAGADDLVDLDREETEELEPAHAARFPTLRLSRLVLDGFLISIPVLKEHSLCGVTLSLKNLVGLLPASHYGGHWSFKKSRIHDGDPDAAIADILRCRAPDLALIDARIGMKGSHLNGRPCSPATQVLLGGADPWAVDAEAARLLGRSWQRVGHLRTTRPLFAPGTAPPLP